MSVLVHNILVFLTHNAVGTFDVQHCDVQHCDVQHCDVQHTLITPPTYLWSVHLPSTQHYNDMKMM